MINVFLPIDGTQTGATTLNQSGPGNNSNKGELRILLCRAQWAGMTLSSYKYTYVSLYYSKGLKLTTDKWERQRQRMRTQTGGRLRYWLFLNLHCDSIFSALHLCFLVERFSTGFCYGSVEPRSASVLTWLWFQLVDWDSVWLTMGTCVNIIS